MKVNDVIYQIILFTTLTWKSNTDHFVFDFTKSKLGKENINKKVSKVIPYIKSRPKDIRISSISNELREIGIQREFSLGLHILFDKNYEFLIKFHKFRDS